MTSNYPAGNETLKQTGLGDRSSLFITPACYQLNAVDIGGQKYSYISADGLQ